MTRINTNVSSLTAQKSLGRSYGELREALTRLSTGLRINVGKDDPAGLIASEVLRADIVSVNRAIVNSERANQMISTADSALGQVSGLLNDIRGLVSAAANTGAMSREQLDANQLQIDSSLEAIDRVAKVTQFQGKRLLDGNLDFITAGLDSNRITGLQVDQANFGTQSEISVAIDVVTQATRAQLTYAFGSIPDDVVLEIGGKEGFEAFSFAKGSLIENMAAAINLVSDALGVTAEVQTEATAGKILASSFGANNDILITADQPGEAEGNLVVKFGSNPGDALAVAYTKANGNDPGKIDVTLETEDWGASSGIVDDGSAPNNAFAITCKVKGTEFDGITIDIADSGAPPPISISYDHGTNKLTFDIEDGVTKAQDIKAFIEADTRLNSLFAVDYLVDNDGSGTLDVADPAWAAFETVGGVDGGDIISTANDVIDAINAKAELDGVVSAATDADNNGHETVTVFEEFLYYGSAPANNRLQFVGPENTPNLRFTSTPGQALSVDTTTEARQEDFSSVVIQGDSADTTFVVTARKKGTDYDNVTVDFVDSTDETVVWDPQSKTLTVRTDVGTRTAAEVMALINNDNYVQEFWRASAFGTASGIPVTDANIATDTWTTSGGLISEGTAIINLETDDDGIVQTTAQKLIDFFDDPVNKATLEPLGISLSHAQGSDGSGRLAPTTTDLEFTSSGTDVQEGNASAVTFAVNGKDARIAILAEQPGLAYDGVTVLFEDSGLATQETVTWNATAKTLIVAIEAGVSTANDVISAINNDAVVGELFDADKGGGGNGTDLVTTSDTATTTGGQVDAGNAAGVAMLGNADEANTGLTFRSTEYGSDAFVSVKPLEGVFAVADRNGAATDRSQGTDIDARVNGILAVGQGLDATINTAALDLTFSMAATVSDGDSTSFTIVGGGAQFQLGPDVVSNQQARLGIQSVSTATLGGVAGRLFELRSGEAKSLNTDVNSAANVVEEVIGQITTLRGRLGAFQRTTLETNVRTLGDTLEALTEAESSIRDADFATETAKLTRAQILVQSGLSVLSIANNNPRNVLALLQ